MKKLVLENSGHNTLVAPTAAWAQDAAKRKRAAWKRLS